MTPDEIKADIEKKLTEFKENSDVIAVPYLSNYQGAITERIHSRGLNSNDQIIGINASRNGKYSPGYERLKKKGGIINKKFYRGSGELIYPINYEVHGELKRQFLVQESNGKAYLGIRTEEQQKIAGYLEKYYKNEVYKPTESELEDAKEVLITVVEEELSRLFNL